LDFYQNYTGEIKVIAILDALQYVASFRSVPCLLSIAQDEEMDHEERLYAIGILGSIGDPFAVESLIALFSSIDVSNPSQDNHLIKINILINLVEIGHPKILPMLKTYVETNETFLDHHPDVKSVLDNPTQFEKDFTENWILRWHLNNEQRNSKALPFFRSKKKWAMAGQEIPDVSRILFDIYHDVYRKVSVNSVFEAFGAVGSMEDISKILDIILSDPKLHDDEISSAFKAIYNIGGNSVLDDVLGRVENHPYPDEEFECEIKNVMSRIFMNNANEAKLRPMMKRCEELTKKLYGDQLRYQFNRDNRRQWDC
jgi:hypothetical protein